MPTTSPVAGFPTSQFHTSTAVASPSSPSRRSVAASASPNRFALHRRNLLQLLLLNVSAPSSSAATISVRKHGKEEELMVGQRGFFDENAVKLLHTMEEQSLVKMATFFISHGSPTMSIDEGLEARGFLKLFRSKVYSALPKAVLVVSAHWDTSEPTVNSIKGPSDTIYDFYGFPQKMYKFKYPAPGAPDLARRVKEMLQDAGFGDVEEDKSRGLDHGAWVPLMLMYPEANIPVCQLSVQSEKDASHHYNMGKALAPLRDEGVLIIGSGSATHNLGALLPDGFLTPRWARDFDSWLTDSLLNGRYEDVNHYEEKAPFAKMAHPWPEHLYPLHVALGAAGDEAKAELIHHSWSNAALSYSSYRFTPAK